MKTILSKKVLIIIVVILVLIASTVTGFLIIGKSSPEKKILGHWVLTEESKEDFHFRYYISDEFYFYEKGRYSDGTGYANYSIDENTLSMSMLFDAYNFSYYIKGDTLAIKSVKTEENEPYIFYERVDDSKEPATKDETTTETTTASSETSIKLLSDDAGLFSKSEETLLNERLAQIREEYSFDIAIHTTNSFDGKSAKEYADDYYDENGYGYGVSKDGCVLVINEKEGEWYLSTGGNGATLINDERLEHIKDAVQPERKDKQYYDAVSTFLNYTLKYL